MYSKDMKCADCEGTNLHWLVWADKNNNYVSESHQSEKGEYWCDDCKEHKE